MSKKENKLYWLVLAASIILVITNPSDRDYTSYLGKSSNSSIDRQQIEYSLKSMYCKSYDNNMQRELCGNLIKTAKQNNPYYLEEWLNGKGYRLFERKNLLLFSFYSLPWSTELNGDGSISSGTLFPILCYRFVEY